MDFVLLVSGLGLFMYVLLLTKCGFNAGRGRINEIERKPWSGMSKIASPLQENGEGGLWKGKCD